MTGSAPHTWTREQVLVHRVRAQQLDRAPGTTLDPDDVTALDLGVQDSGPDGALWALAIRGAAPDPAGLVWTWTLRGAPHAYRRRHVADVVAATAAWSEADAVKRVFDAAPRLAEAGVTVLDALDRIAREMREVVERPTVKGEVSAALHRRLPSPWQRWCRPCQAEHVHEQTFRLAAPLAGLELEHGTSPPVLRRVPGWRGPATDPDPALDPVRAALHLLGPASHRDVAGYLDTSVAEVRQHWPADAEEVSVEGARRWVVGGAEPDVAGGERSVVRLLGPYDLFLQARDRDLLVPDTARRKATWPVLGRPGVILHGHDLAGTWRPRASGRKLRLLLEPWGRLPRRALLEEQAERLAAHRGVAFAGFVEG